MRCIIAGGREITSYLYVENAIKQCPWYYKITEIVSGTARGVDSLGEHWAYRNDLLIKRFAPDWDKFGKAAGPLRNMEMAKYAEALIAIPGAGPGTFNMVDVAKQCNLQIYVYFPFEKS